MKVKNKKRAIAAVFTWLAFGLAMPPISFAQQLGFKARPDSTDRIIVKLRDPQTARAQILSADHLSTLNATAGVTLEHFRPMSGGAQVMKLPRRMPLAEAQAVAVRLNADPSVEYAEPDRRMFPMLAPNDPRYSDQWHYKSPSAPDNVAGGANLPGAWDITAGSASLVVAVIDTGIRLDHADLVGRTVQGYDFVSQDAPGVFLSANDGDGRDPDPSDPGDWITAAEDGGTAAGGFFLGCADPAPGGQTSNSSWHGTHVAGTIGALGNNSTGVAGINWMSGILPVRVLGKCGGYLSDIVDGARWAAGLSVTGIPANANPAKVLNLSLGGPGACSTTEQTVIDAIVAAGAVVVVAAGNDNVNASGFSPANCNGVISVAAVNRAGGRAFYSNFGTTVKITAPGGEWVSIPFDPLSILSTLNSGLTTPVASPGGDIYQYYQGTSMAAPHVAGVASLMLSLRPNMKPSRTLAFLQQTARAFPGGSTCSTSNCGAGMLDAAAAAAAVNATVAPTANAGTNLDGGIGKVVTLSGSGTPTAPAAIASYAWTQTVGTAVTLSRANTATPRFTVPNIAVNSVLTFSLTVTDDVGMTSADTVDVTVVYPVPSAASLSPAIAAPGGAAFTLTVNGNGFFNGVSTVHWNGSARTTNFVSSTRLTASISAADIATAGTIDVAVVNTAPGGGTSNVRKLTVSSSVSSSGGGGGCFIATAAYGSPMVQDVRYLRAFRDQYLLTNKFGRKFVELYYRFSPSLTDKLRPHDDLRAVVRAVLAPLVMLSKWIVDADAVERQTADQP